MQKNCLAEKRIEHLSQCFSTWGSSTIFGAATGRYFMREAALDML